MDCEKQTTEYKSLLKIRTGDKGFKDLSVTCVALANAQGGRIFIGYDDKKKAPLPEQHVTPDEVNEAVTKLRSLCFNVGLVASEICTDDTGSQYFIVSVSPSMHSVATTSDGRIYIRVADKCEPVRSEDLQRLGEEKGAYQWELVRTKYLLDGVALDALRQLANDIRKSSRVRQHVKQMDDAELAENYPKELLLDIEQKAVELTYSYEFPNGLFRKQIRHYHPKLVRELLVNALAHKSYTISSDIMIKVFSDRLEISNPGGLPLGITKDNILHAKHRRNPNMIELLSALEMMEGEGSGYDLIYELNAMEAKNPPMIESSYNEVTVIQNAEIIDTELLPLLDFVLQNYQLTQKAFTAFGIIAREKKVFSTRLSAILQLQEEDRLRSYTDKLLKDNIIGRNGVKKGTQFFVNPQLIKNAKVNLKTTLKTVEPYVLRTLIMEDLRAHPKSKISEIGGRLPEIDLQELRKMIYSMVDVELITEGARTDRRYALK